MVTAELDPICDLCDQVDLEFDPFTELCAEDAEALLRNYGNEVEDHLCDEIESDGDIRCGCECKGKRKAELRNR